MNPIVEVNVQSEIGKLNGVIIHTPGEEVENMTPENAERALYSDIINLSIARKEYKQISGVLSKLTKTYEVKDPKMVLGAIDHFSINVKDIDDAFRFINEAGMNNTNDFIHFLPFFENGVKFFKIEGPNKETVEFNQYV